MSRDEPVWVALPNWLAYEEEFVPSVGQILELSLELNAEEAWAPCAALGAQIKCSAGAQQFTSVVCGTTSKDVIPDLEGPRVTPRRLASVIDVGTFSFWASFPWPDPIETAQHRRIGMRGVFSMVRTFIPTRPETLAVKSTFKVIAVVPLDWSGKPEPEDLYLLVLPVGDENRGRPSC